MAETDAKQAKEKTVISLLIVMVLALGFAWSFVVFRKTEAILSGEYAQQLQETPPVPDATANEEISAVQQTNAALTSIGEARRQSMQTALLAEATGRFPIANREMIPALRVAVVQQTDPEAVVEDSPPEITVRAVLLLGQTAIATIDIAGDGDGIIVQPGTRFDGGSGKILSINSKGVKYQWKKKRYEALFAQ